jgi:hypothetical protein
MDNITPAAPESLAAELVRRGLPAEYAQRAASEFADHQLDLVNELKLNGIDEIAARAEASRRLGDDRMLVRKTVREYRQRCWCGRWQLLTFLLAPIPALCLLWLGMAAILVGIGSLCDWLGYELSQVDGRTSLFERSFVEAMWGVTFLGSPMVVTAWFGRLAYRRGLAVYWAIAVGVQMALFVGLTQFNVDYQRCTLTVGLPIDMPALSGWIHWYFGGTWRHLTQVVVPLVLGLAIFAVQVAGRRRAMSELAC